MKPDEKNVPYSHVSVAQVPDPFRPLFWTVQVCAAGLKNDITKEVVQQVMDTCSATASAIGQGVMHTAQAPGTQAPAPAQDPRPRPEKGHHLHLLICEKIMPPLSPEKAIAAGWAIIEKMALQGYDVSRPKTWAQHATKGVAHSHDLATGLPKPYLVIVEIGDGLGLRPWFYTEDGNLTASITKADRFDEIELAEGVIDRALSSLAKLGLSASIVRDEEIQLVDTKTGDVWPLAKFAAPGFTDDGLS